MFKKILDSKLILEIIQLKHFKQCCGTHFLILMLLQLLIQPISKPT